MAQRTTVVLDDDLDGGPADQTVTFSLDDVAYAIDLTDANAAALRDALAVWVAHARKTARPSRAAGSSPRRRNEPRTDLSAVRAWGKENGFAVSERGRIGSDLQQAYDRAQVDADTGHADTGHADTGAADAQTGPHPGFSEG